MGGDTDKKVVILLPLCATYTITTFYFEHLQNIKTTKVKYLGLSRVI